MHMAQNEGGKRIDKAIKTRRIKYTMPYRITLSRPG